MIITELYRNYFQKSRSFLYPMLGIKKNAPFSPMQTFIAWEKMYQPTDRKLIVTFECLDSSLWNHFLTRVIMGNPMLEKIFYSEDGTKVICVFDYNCVKEDFDSFLAGKYSRLGLQIKQKIREYYGYQSSEWAYMETFLFPYRHFSSYSRLLNISESELRDVGELCDLPDPGREKLVMEHRKKEAKAIY